MQIETEFVFIFAIIAQSMKKGLHIMQIETKVLMMTGPFTNFRMKKGLHIMQIVLTNNLQPTTYNIVCCQL